MDIVCSIFVSAAISFTITTTSVFEWLRELVAKIHPKMEQLIFCPWCLNHYVVATMLLVLDIDLVDISNYYIIRFLFTLFLIVGAAGILHYVLLRAYTPVISMMVERKIAKLAKKDQEE